MTQGDLEKRYAELRRTENSLFNYSMSIKENLEEINCNVKTHSHLVERALQIPNPKGKIIVTDSQKEALLRLFENMWINELYLSTVARPNPTHFFYLEYICFYYSLFSAVSIVERILNPGQRGDKHRSKIQNFNSHMMKNKILRDLYFPPFTLVVRQGTLDVCGTKVTCDNGQSLLTSWINDYDTARHQGVLGRSGSLVQTDIYTLRICRSLVKYCNEKKKYNSVSFINYFMSFRHFFHYRASSILGGHDYDVRKLVDRCRNSMREILDVSNFISEIFYCMKIDNDSLSCRRADFINSVLSGSEIYEFELSFLERRGNSLLKFQQKNEKVEKNHIAGMNGSL
ncbi:MAG: hypothetical protein WBA22_04135 [Candidatus Methanofastidiosia archaeon]